MSGFLTSGQRRSARRFAPNDAIAGPEEYALKKTQFEHIQSEDFAHAKGEGSQMRRIRAA